MQRRVETFKHPATHGLDRRLRPGRSTEYKLAPERAVEKKRRLMEKQYRECLPMAILSQLLHEVATTEYPSGRTEPCLRSEIKRKLPRSAETCKKLSKSRGTKTES